MVPDDEVVELNDEEEVVRLGAADGRKERVMKIDRTGAGALGTTPVNDENAAMIDEMDVGEVEEVDPEDVWHQEKKQSPIGLVVLAGVLGLLVLGVSLYFIPRGDIRVDRRAARLAAEREAEAQSLQEAGVLMGRIETVARAYLEAGTVEEKLRHVRHRERVKPLMEKYYEEHSLAPRGFQGVTAFYPVGVENDPFLFLQVRGADGTLIPLLLEQVGEDELVVDWETDVAYQPVPVAEFIDRKVEEPTDFRVFVKLDVFYAYEFADATRYQSLMLTERDSDAYMFGYVERGSAAHERMMEILKDNPRGKEPMLLRLRFLPDSRGARSVLVEEVVAQRWAVVEAPVEGGE